MFQILRHFKTRSHVFSFYGSRGGMLTAGRVSVSRR